MISRLATFTFLVLLSAALASSQPAISSFTPQASELGSSITIQGENFSTVPTLNRVHVGAAQAEVTSASSSQLVVSVPCAATTGAIVVTDVVTRLSSVSTLFFVPRFVGTGPLTFAFAHTAPDFAMPNRIISADVNNDGVLDLLVGSHVDNHIYLTLGNASGNFGSPRSIEVGPGGIGQRPQGIAAGDLNGDGYQDIVVANYQDGIWAGTASVLFGTGTGDFLPESQLALHSNPIDIGIQDFNNDGYLDLLVTGQDGIDVFLGDGNGGFTQSFFTQEAGFPESTTADFDQDGNIDLATSRNDDHVVIGWGDGTGAFPSITLIEVGRPGDIQVGDFNEDGRQDLVVADIDSGIVVLTNLGGRAFHAGVLNVVQHAPWGSGGVAGIGIAALNGDAHLDLAVCLFSLDTIVVLTGNGNGLFTPGGRLGSVSQPAFVAAGDYNCDGRSDLAVTEHVANSVALLMNTTQEAPDDHKVDVCHKGRTIRVDRHAVKAHLAHGDQLGPCETGRVAEKVQGEGPLKDFTVGSYPNPFNPSTMIRYALPVKSVVTLKIFDQLGREVETLVDELQDAGIHSVEWNTADRTSHPISSGLYYFRLQAGDLVRLGRMVLLK